MQATRFVTFDYCIIRDLLLAFATKLNKSNRSNSPFMLRSNHEKAIASLFDGLPDEPQKRLSAIADLYSAIRKRTDKELRPVIAALIKRSPQLDYHQKGQLSHQINQVLQDARLAIVNPASRMPASLMYNRPRQSSHLSRLYLRDSKLAADGKRHTMLLGETSLPEIELIATVPDVLPDSQEPFALGR